MFFLERELKKGIARHVDASSVVESLIDNGELANKTARLVEIVVKKKRSVAKNVLIRRLFF